MTETGDSLVGKRFNNRYQILEKVGDGRAGQVYRAEQESTGGLVAIKILNTKYTDDPAAVEALSQRIKSLLRLKHSGVVAPIEFGKAEDGRSFIVSESIPGVTLRQVMEEKGKIPLDEFFDIAEQLLEIMEFVHQKDIQHLHLNLDNIIMSTHGGKMEVKILNFALPLGPGSKDLLLTKKSDEGSETVWEPSWYFSPEQARGDGQINGASSDIYSMGAIFYHMLTGQAPYPTASGLDAIEKNLNQPPPSMRKLNPEIPWQVETAIQRMMDITPSERHQSAEASRKGVVRRELWERIQTQKAGGYQEKKGKVLDMRRGLWAALLIIALAAGYNFLSPGSESQQASGAIPTSKQEEEAIKPPEINSPPSNDSGSAQSSSLASRIGGLFASGDKSAKPRENRKPGTKDMALVKGGCFPMGDNFGDSSRFQKVNSSGAIEYVHTYLSFELPIHEICLKDFWMDKYEVSQELFLERTNSNPSMHLGCVKCPVESVEWARAADFCENQGKRLPTEAEWEYAAREGGKLVRFGNGKADITLDDANFSVPPDSPDIVNVRGKPVAVGSYAPNALGLFDMAGNVQEWTADLHNAYDKNSPMYSHAPLSGRDLIGQDRVSRGGSFSLRKDQVRASARMRNPEKTRSEDTGFRCVMDTK